MAGNIYVGGGLSGNVLVASKISPAQARGRLKAGWSDDPDVQAMMRADLLAETRQKRLYDWIFLVVGIVLAPTVIGLAVTVVVPMALWGFARAKHNEQVVDAAIEQVRATFGELGSAL